MLPPPHRTTTTEEATATLSTTNLVVQDFPSRQTSSSLPALNPFTNFAHSAIFGAAVAQLLQLMLHVGREFRIPPTHTHAHTHTSSFQSPA